MFDELLSSSSPSGHELAAVYVVKLLAASLPKFL